MHPSVLFIYLKAFLHYGPENFVGCQSLVNQRDLGTLYYLSKFITGLNLQPTQKYRGLCKNLDLSLLYCDFKQDWPTFIL